MDRGIKMKNPTYDAIIKSAEKEANEAANKWLTMAKKRGPLFEVMSGGCNVGSLLDVCGGAYLKVTDGRRKFVKYLLDSYNSNSHYRSCVTIPHDFLGRQERGLHEAACKAYFKVLQENNVDCGLRYHSYID